MTTIHFNYGLWDSAPMPDRFRATMQAWKTFYPQFEQCVWDKAQADNLIAKLPTAWRQTYHCLPRPIQQADFLRYAIMREHGGIYSDLDCLPLNGELLPMIQSMGPSNVLLLTEFVLGKGERTSAEPVPDEQVRLANFWFASTPRHPFWDQVLTEVSKRSFLPVRDNYDVIRSTGPVMLSTVYDRCTRTDLRLLSLRQSASLVRHIYLSTWKS